MIRVDDIAAEEDSDHELLCYLQLLETNKPYLVNIMRVPGEMLFSFYVEVLFQNNFLTVIWFLL